MKMDLLFKLKTLEFYIVMSIPVLFGMITYKELKECIKKAKSEVSNQVKKWKKINLKL